VNEPSRGEIQQHQASGRILVVDDDQAVLDAVGDTLMDQGYDAMRAASAAEALRVLEAERPDLIITDFMMPETNGVQFLVEVVKRYGAIPALLVTASPVPYAGEAIRAAGLTNPVVRKPFDLTALLELVGRYVPHDDRAH
jgi:CheY-like chemotaxis protein